MASNYSGAIDSFTTKVDGSTRNDQSHVNDLQDAITATQSAMGESPQGGFADIKARIAPLDFASGTRMYFGDAAAPTGWTQDNSNLNRTLRVMSGSAGSTGGSVGIAGGSVTSAIETSHVHGGSATHTDDNTSFSDNGTGVFSFSDSGFTPTHGNVGGATDHTHTPTYNIAYRNVLEASRDVV